MRVHREMKKIEKTAEKTKKMLRKLKKVYESPQG
jgi:hypothetical protein